MKGFTAESSLLLELTSDALKALSTTNASKFLQFIIHLNSFRKIAMKRPF